MWNSLIDTGDAGVQILQAYVVKEELRSVLALAGTNPERHIIRTSLDSFYQHAAAADAEPRMKWLRHSHRHRR
jgi:transposase